MGKVYIEFWGYDNDEKYLARKQKKQAIYQKYNFNLIELTEEEVLNLDDILPIVVEGLGGRLIDGFLVPHALRGNAWVYAERHGTRNAQCYLLLCHICWGSFFTHNLCYPNLPC